MPVNSRKVLPANHPFKGGGIAFGYSRPSDSKKPSEEPAEPSTNPQEGMELAAGSAYEMALRKSFRDMGAPERAQSQSSEPGPESKE